MTISGEELGVELYDLRQAGRISLPEVAAIYAQASRHMHNTSWQQTEGFDQQRNVVYEPNELNVGFDDSDIPVFNGNGTAGYTATVEEGTALGPVFGPWTSLRDTLQRYLAFTATSLVTAGQALEQIADAYAATDGVAATVLDELSQGLDESPAVPEVMLPGDPHETETVDHDISIPIPFGEDVTILEYETEEPVEETTNPLGVN